MNGMDLEKSDTFDYNEILDLNDFCRHVWEQKFLKFLGILDRHFRSLKSSKNENTRMSRFYQNLDEKYIFIIKSHIPEKFLNTKKKVKNF